MSKTYWNKFYKDNFNFNDKPSSFCQFVAQYLKSYPKHITLIDLGCGNGRDLLYFVNIGYKSTGIDKSDAVYYALSRHNNINMICDSFVSYDYSDYDIYYSRFTIHAISYDEVLEFIKNLSIKMKIGSILFIETRSIKGTGYENMEWCKVSFSSGIGSEHSRTLFSIDHLIMLFVTCGLTLEFKIDDNNLSVFNGENPYLIRLVFRKY
jgi:SAM-dependent methyltransferase